MPWAAFKETIVGTDTSPLNSHIFMIPLAMGEFQYIYERSRNVTYAN
jgi:hypothetical protein